MTQKNGYSFKDMQNGMCRAKGTNLTVHFKNTVETANAIRNMTIQRATIYLNNVLAHKECVPFKKYNRKVGRCAQAKAFKTTQGRWPHKSAKFLLDLLRNAIGNAEYFELECEKLYIRHIQVNPAPINRRRTFRAHGRITAYNRHPCHVQVVLAEKKQD